MKNILIFGATSTIAAACSRLWIAQGAHLVVTGRDKVKLNALVDDLRARAQPGQSVESIETDLNDLDRHTHLIQTAERLIGPIDVVLIAHGSLPDQRKCQQFVATALQEITTNALSVISLLTLVANLFEVRKAGTIAVIGSVAGDRGRQSNYVYGAAKGMIDVFLAGLRGRMCKCNVAVVTIKPGFVDTLMTAHIHPKGALWAQPETVATGIIAAIADRRAVVYLPGIWRYIMFFVRAVPEAIFKRLAL